MIRLNEMRRVPAAVCRGISTPSTPRDIQCWHHQLLRTRPFLRSTTPLRTLLPLRTRRAMHYTITFGDRGKRQPPQDDTFCPPLLWESKGKVPTWKLPEEELHACVIEEDIPRLRELLASGSSVSGKGVEGVARRSSNPHGSPLHLAAALGSLAAVDALLDAGADPTLPLQNDLTPPQKSRRHLTPIDVAIAYNHHQIVARLWGVMCDWRVRSDKKPDSSLFYAADDAMQNAAEDGHAETLEILLSSWQQWEQRHNRGFHEHLLQPAAADLNIHVVNALLAHRELCHPSSLNNALLAAADKSSNLVHGYAGTLRSGLGYTHQQALISRLVEAGADPNVTTGRAMQPLIARIVGAADLTGALKTLLEKGADPNLADCEGFAALHKASARVTRLSRGPESVKPEYVWNETAVQLLLDHGASATFRSKNGITPLHTAAYGSCRNIFNLLVTAAQKPDKSLTSVLHSKTDRQESLLHYAALGGRLDLMEMLLDQGLDVNEKHATGWTPLLCALTPEGRAPQTFRNDAAQKTLSVAVRAAQLLISRGADIRVVSDNGWTPMHLLALHYGFGSHGGAKKLALTLLQAQESAKFSLPTPMPRTMQDWYGFSDDYWYGFDYWLGIDQWQQFGAENPGRDQTLLHWAAEHCSYSTVEALLETGADPLAKDNHGRTPAMTAQKFGHQTDPRADEEMDPMTGTLKEDSTLKDKIISLLAAAGGGTGQETPAPSARPEPLCQDRRCEVCRKFRET